MTGTTMDTRRRQRDKAERKGLGFTTGLDIFLQEGRKLRLIASFPGLTIDLLPAPPRSKPIASVAIGAESALDVLTMLACPDAKTPIGWAADPNCAFMIEWQDGAPVLAFDNEGVPIGGATLQQSTLREVRDVLGLFSAHWQGMMLDAEGNVA